MFLEVIENKFTQDLLENRYSDWIEAYTCGNCWDLALRLHEITKLPLVLCNNTPLPKFYCWHIVCVYKDRYVDIQGIHDVDEMTELYDYITHYHDISYETLLENTDHYTPLAVTPKIAAVMAELCLT